MLLTFNDLIYNTQYLKEISNFEVIKFNRWLIRFYEKNYRFMNFINIVKFKLK